MRRRYRARQTNGEREERCVGQKSEWGAWQGTENHASTSASLAPIYYHLQERFIACVRACCFGLPVPLLSGNSVRFFPRRPHRSTSPHILPPWVVVMFPISSTNLSMPHKWKAPSKNGEALGTMLFPPKMHGCFAEFMHD